MKKSFLFCLIFCIAIIANGQIEITHYIDSIAAKHIAKNHGNALIIGINTGGKEQIFTYGETEKGNNKKPDPNTVFEIGQLTQIFTSALFAQMSIKGLINPDEPIRKFLPVDVPAPVYREIVCEPVLMDDVIYEKGFSINEKYTRYICKPDRSSKPQPILLCYLSTHTSGLPVKPANHKVKAKNPYSGYSKENLYDFLRSYTLAKPIGYDYQYSDLNMALLGHILELKAGKSYAELLDSNIILPLAMESTSIKNKESARLLAGHDAKGKTVPYWDYDVMAPSGALHSDMEDMMKLLSMNISLENSELKNIFDYMHNPRIRFTNKKHGTIEAALGWLVSPLGKEDKKYVWQEGITGGFSSFIGFVETTRTGIVIMSNSAVPVDNLGKEVLQKIN